VLYAVFLLQAIARFLRKRWRINTSLRAMTVKRCVGCLRHLCTWKWTGWV